MVRICTCLCMCLLCMCLLLANETDAPLNQSVKDCPPKCLCTQQVSELGSERHVNCSGQNLTIVPSTTFDEPVSLLDVSFNDLYTLEDNTFFQYESVNSIYLVACKLQNISEKTFQLLENLTCVDLSDNLLTKVSPNLFNSNHRLRELKIRINDLSDLQWNTTLLNGPPSLSFLDLHKCQISLLSSVTFSSLPNLQEIDISNNYLTIFRIDTLSALQQLKDVNLENNPFTCGLEFETLCSEMQSNPSLFHNRTIACRPKNGGWKKCDPKTPSSLHLPMTTLSVTPSYEPDTNANTPLQPSATLSHNPDTNTNTTLKSSMTPSNKSDASRNTTDNPTTPFDNPTTPSENPTTPCDNPTTPSEEESYIIFWEVLGYSILVIIIMVALGKFICVIFDRLVKNYSGGNAPNVNGETSPLTSSGESVGKQD